MEETVKKQRAQTMKGSMRNRVRKYIEDHHMIMPGDLILAGVSGGADSVCLFFLLQSLKEELHFDMAVMHINHNLRETAGRDEQFVQNLCEAYGVSFFVRQVDVPALAAAQGASIEEAARAARYEAFYEQALFLSSRRGQQVKLALAHHENDQAETVLFHLFRGSSLTGLVGMKPMRRQESLWVIRPLLCLDREEIEDILRGQGISFMTDETNADNRYARNRIRNEILPAASQFICQESVKHIAQTASELAGLEDYLNEVVNAEYESLIYRMDKEEADGHLTGKACEPVKGADSQVGQSQDGLRQGKLLRIAAVPFIGKHSYLQRKILYCAITEAAGSSKDITRQHVESVRKLFWMQTGRQIDLPYGLLARRDYDAVELFRQESKMPVKEQEMWEIPLVLQGITNLPGGIQLHARLFSYEKEMEIPKNKYTKWFDYDKIKQCPVIRTRRTSDFFYIDDTHKKTVKDYMINEKIKRSDREKLYLICLDHHMLWMPGYRISAYYKVHQDTTRVLELTYLGGTKDGGQNQCHDL